MNSISQRVKEWSDITRQISNFYSSQTRALVHHLYEKGYSYQQVADILGVSRQAVNDAYPKEKHEKNWE